MSWRAKSFEEILAETLGLRCCVSNEPQAYYFTYDLYYMIICFKRNAHMGMKYLVFRLSIIMTAVLIVSCSKPQEKEMTMNQLQVIGSHNSYKQKIEDPLMEIILAKDSGTIGLDYFHIPIQEQLELGLRSLEIDALHDPEGGRYSEPVGLKLLREKGVTPKPFDTFNQLSEPGIKVLHVPDIDFRSHCITFISCLKEVKEWSDLNPNHVPIIITINPKNSGLKEPGLTPVLRFTKNVLDSLDQEILSVFSLSNMITPDLVQGEFPSLREAVLSKGWPSLEESKGKVLFVLDAGSTITNMYIENSLKCKPMFPNVEDEDHPLAAFFIMNDPKAQQEDIQKRVKAGFMVRTRADADTKEARTGDLSRLEAAIASGAQVISTDYYLDRISPSGKFQVSLKESKYQTCNPLIAPAKCPL
jgi:hypothetical protein